MSEELKQAAQQALEALEHSEKDTADFQRLNTDQTSVAIKSLRQALTQRPAAQATAEPVGEVVAWLYAEDGETKFGHPRGYRPDDARPLVFGDTRPAPGVPPTKDQIREVFIGNGFTVKEGQADLKPYVYAAADALLKLVSPAPGVPDGFALVPVEPTIAMLIAGNESRISMEHQTRESAIWSAMLAAAQAKGADK